MQISLQQLLKDKRVVEEIERHRWVEGEKKGKDIGFQAAAEDWIIATRMSGLNITSQNFQPNTIILFF